MDRAVKEVRLTRQTKGKCHHGQVDAENVPTAALRVPGTSFENGSTEPLCVICESCYDSLKLRRTLNMRALAMAIAWIDCDSDR